jgi:hypothetical protein
MRVRVHSAIDGAAGLAAAPVLVVSDTSAIATTATRRTPDATSVETMRGS